jgi:hypothetical protein
VAEAEDGSGCHEWVPVLIKVEEMGCSPLALC